MSHQLTLFCVCVYQWFASRVNGRHGSTSTSHLTTRCCTNVYAASVELTPVTRRHFDDRRYALNYATIQLTPSPAAAAAAAVHRRRLRASGRQHHRNWNPDPINRRQSVTMKYCQMRRWTGGRIIVIILNSTVTVATSAHLGFVADVLQQLVSQNITHEHDAMCCRLCYRAPATTLTLYTGLINFN